MTPPDLAALARDLRANIRAPGADRLDRAEVEALLKRALETVATLSRTAGRAEGLETAIEALRVLASEKSL